jgi:hypothetical protein
MDNKEFLSRIGALIADIELVQILNDKQSDGLLQQCRNEFDGVNQIIDFLWRKYSSLKNNVDDGIVLWLKAGAGFEIINTNKIHFKDELNFEFVESGYNLRRAELDHRYNDSD